jgi:hypothetical protein
MPSSKNRTKGSLQRKRSFSYSALSAMIVAALALPILPAQAEAVGEHAMKSVSSLTAFLRI